MAPQNSTLIHQLHNESDDDDDFPSVAASERLSTNMRDLMDNYSPILRPKSAGDRLLSQFATSKPTVAGIYIPPSTQKKSILAKNGKTTYESDDNEENLEDDSWYGDPDEEQEIPIWIRGEPRFVSGITNTTTCNDVIAALINDEIQSGQYTKMDEVRYSVDDYVITERWRDVESELDGNEAILPIFLAWGEAQKEMKFKLKINKKKILEAKIPEKKLEKKEKMTMVTKLMRRVLKQGDYIQKHLFVLKDDKKESNRYTKKSYNKQLFYENYLARNSNGTISTVVPSACSSIERLYCKCCGNGANSTKKRLTITDNLRVRPCPEPKMLENVSLEPLDDKLRAGDVFEDNVRTDDELLLIIENDEDSNEMFVDDTTIIAHIDNDSGNGSIGKNSEIQNEKVSVEPISDYSSSSSTTQEQITATPKRKTRSLREYNELRKHSLNHHAFHITSDPLKFDEERFRKSNKNRSDKFDGVRFEIMLKMSEMKQLLVREEMLITQIQMQCAKYRAENELYNSRQSFDELRVDEIQKNLEKFAQEIIENEQELFATKLEVEEKAKNIQELKILLENGTSEEEIRKEKLLSKEKIDEKIQIEEVEEEKSEKEPSPVMIRRRWSMERLEFIENIYEFCDNNKSVLI